MHEHIQLQLLHTHIWPHTQREVFSPNAETRRPCHASVYTTVTHSKWTFRNREGLNIFYILLIYYPQMDNKLLPVWPEQSGCELKHHSVPCPAPADFELRYPVPRCFSCSAAACADYDGPHSGSPQASRSWLAPDVVFRPQMIRYVMEGQLDLASACAGAPTSPEVRAEHGHTSYIYVLFR